MNMQRIALALLAVAGLSTMTACKKRKKVPDNQVIIIERDQVLGMRESGVLPEIIEIDWEEADGK